MENLSVIHQWLSDSLCRVATGAGFGTRELYSDADEALFSVQLPIVLNGIVEVITSGDLQDRSIVLMLPTIDEYTSEDDLWQAFELAQPKLLGALLDVVAAAMANQPGVELDDLPRMADFARWTAAACPALGWDVDEFLDTYTNNRAQANETTLDASPLVGPLRKLGDFEGSATELLEELVGSSVTAPPGRRCGRSRRRRCPARCADWRRTCAGRTRRSRSHSTARGSREAASSG